MSEERVGPLPKVDLDKPVGSVWLPAALILAATGLGVVTAQLPFTAGSPLVDLFAPVGVEALK